MKHVKVSFLLWINKEFKGKSENVNNFTQTILLNRLDNQEEMVHFQ